MRYGKLETLWVYYGIPFLHKEENSLWVYVSIRLFILFRLGDIPIYKKRNIRNLTFLTFSFKDHWKVVHGWMCCTNFLCYYFLDELYYSFLFENSSYIKSDHIKLCHWSASQIGISNYWLYYSSMKNHSAHLLLFNCLGILWIFPYWFEVHTQIMRDCPHMLLWSRRFCMQSPAWIPVLLICNAFSYVGYKFEL